MSGFSSDAYRDLPRMLAVTESGQTAGTVGVRGRQEGEEEKGRRRGGEGRVKEGGEEWEGRKGEGRKRADKRAVEIRG